MRRRVAPILVVFALALAGMPARADNVAPGFSRYCDGGASRAIGEGPFSQVRLHTEILMRSFNRACRAEAGLMTYLGTGDRRGIQGLLSRTRQYGAADVSLTTAEKAQVELGFRGWTSPVHQIPVSVNGLAVAYNVPCPGPPVKFRSRVLALAYEGVITNWNDRLLLVDNEWLAGCNRTIRLTKRADQSGTTAVFQDYLAKRNAEWIPFRRGLAVQDWPSLDFACAGLGDAGMVNCINSVTGAIGYVSIAAAKTYRMPVALIENASASFVAPTEAGCSAAAETAVIPPGTSSQTLSNGMAVPWVPSTLGDWSTVSITDAPDSVGTDGVRRSYPVCSFGYVFVLQRWWSGYGRTAKGSALRTLVDYLLVSLSDSVQARLGLAGYSPLPPRIRQVSRDGVNSLSIFNFTTLCGQRISAADRNVDLCV